MINGGFGLVLDGTEDAERKARRVLSWDVANGVSDRQHPQGSPLRRLQTLLPPESPAALLPLRCPPATASVSLHGRQTALHLGCFLASLWPRATASVCI